MQEKNVKKKRSRSKYTYPYTKQCATPGCNNTVTIENYYNNRIMYCNKCATERRYKQRKFLRKSFDDKYYEKLFQRLNLNIDNQDYEKYKQQYQALTAIEIANNGTPKSPCLSCEIHLRGISKKNSICDDCKRRVAYSEFLAGDNGSYATNMNYDICEPLSNCK